MRYFDRKKSFLFCLFNFIFFFSSVTCQRGNSVRPQRLASDGREIGEFIRKPVGKTRVTAVVLFVAFQRRFSANRRCRTLELTAAFRERPDRTFYNRRVDLWTRSRLILSKRAVTILVQSPPRESMIIILHIILYVRVCPPHNNNNIPCCILLYGWAPAR